MSNQLHFNIIVRNIKTDAKYACQMTAEFFNMMKPEMPIEVFARTCRQTRHGLVPRGRKTRIFSQMMFRRDFLEIYSNDVSNIR